ncbi:hypothetical protein A4G28_18785 [Mycobacterium ostraviense]|uniref:Uncharacterized protein n=1 Tax=Mycobacterium ostraviense TaxID=2738409 RepID=A0A164A3V8_9MYCO|nr:hypothetical protein A4G28_18785 [Mycobacterium ostraviense]
MIGQRHQESAEQKGALGFAEWLLARLEPVHEPVRPRSVRTAATVATLRGSVAGIAPRIAGISSAASIRGSSGAR